jgi:predicted outer membrane repeat protein
LFTNETTSIHVGIKNFKIINANTTEIASAIFSVNAAVLLENCIFANNIAPPNQKLSATIAIYQYNGDKVTNSFEGLQFENNTADYGSISIIAVDASSNRISFKNCTFMDEATYVVVSILFALERYNTSYNNVFTFEHINFLGSNRYNSLGYLQNALQIINHGDVFNSHYHFQDVYIENFHGYMNYSGPFTIFLGENTINTTFDMMQCKFKNNFATFNENQSTLLLSKIFAQNSVINSTFIMRNITIGQNTGWEQCFAISAKDMKTTELLIDNFRAESNSDKKRMASAFSLTASVATNNTVVLSNSTFDRNLCVCGALIVVFTQGNYNKIEIIGSEFHRNFGDFGSAISIFIPPAQLATFDCDGSPREYDYTNWIVIEECRFLENLILDCLSCMGGALSVANSHASISDSLFYNNEAQLFGGSIYADGTASLYLSNTSFRTDANSTISSRRGHFVYFAAYGELIITNNTEMILQRQLPMDVTMLELVMGKFDRSSIMNSLWFRKQILYGQFEHYFVF